MGGAAGAAAALLLGAKHIWLWTDPAHASGETAHLIAHKAAYLNLPSFTIRALVYFTIWTAYSYRLRSLSILQDRTGEVYRSLAAVRWLGPWTVLDGAAGVDPDILAADLLA